MTLAYAPQTAVNSDLVMDVAQIGVVVIGRNEGDRLHRCLQSVLAQTESVVYVDSGSTDDSCDMARSLGIDVVELDTSVPFSAARARNAGFDWLYRNYPAVKYVQFVDGDCEVVDGWLMAGAMTFWQDPRIVAVCGWRRERYPERSLYNRICDVEWHWGAVGEIAQAGGDVMIRADVFQAIKGYNPAVIAGEDDEIGVRLRQSGGKIIRLDRDSTIHDANMLQWQQWWRRAQRCGYAYGLVYALHGAPPERKYVREVRRVMLWGLALPLVALLAAIPTYGLSLLLLLRYPLGIVRIMRNTRKQGFSQDDSRAWGLSCGLSVFPEVMGLLQFYWKKLRRRKHQIIEYKGATV
jgi:GT2 family glycosyltransferase